MLRARLTDLLCELRDRFADLDVHVVTSLAPGADQLALGVAHDLGMTTSILLPMPFDAMAADFEDDSVEHARSLLDDRPVVCLSRTAHAPDERDARAAQYEFLGVYLAAHCHLLVAIWDGRSPALPGGTAQIVDFHHTGHTVFQERSAVRSPIDHSEDESDLVYQIGCSRAGETNSEPTELALGWLTRDPEDQDRAELPDRYAKVFDRQGELARELQGTTETLPEAVDALAVRYQRLTFRSLMAAFLLTGGAAASFVVYADLIDHPIALATYVVLMMAAIGTQQLARWREWQRKYVDYRGLAEALRTVAFWRRAGVRPVERTMFPHDHFLRRQELELGWIRNVLRGVGLVTDATGETSADELYRVCREWVEEQSAYYMRARDRLARRARWLSRVSTASFSLGLVAVAVISVRTIVGTTANDVLIALMGVLPMAAALVASYVYRLSLRENVAQYSYMVRIHTNAERALAAAADDASRRDILRALGEASFDEHGLWLQRNRERPITHGAVSM